MDFENIEPAIQEHSISQYAGELINVAAQSCDSGFDVLKALSPAA